MAESMMKPEIGAPGSVKTPRGKSMSDGWFSTLLITPAMIIIAFFALIPLFYAINVSFRKADLTHGGIQQFIGLVNYRHVLVDSYFWQSVGITLKFTLTAVVIEMLLGIAVAFLIVNVTKGKGLIRSMLILPLATAPAVTGLFWRYLYDTQFGLYNYFLSLLNMPQPNWLGDIKIALWAVVLFDVWQWMPYVALIILAGLTSLPKEPFEAAELDGASVIRILTKITFPMLKPVLILVGILRTIDCLRLYDAVAVLTRGGPGTVTETMTYYLWRTGLQFFRMDYASAMSLLFLYAVVVASMFALRPLLNTFASRAGSR